MNETSLIICSTCNEVFNTQDEKEEHAFRAHYEKSSGLRRAREWADIML